MPAVGPFGIKFGGFPPPAKPGRGR